MKKTLSIQITVWNADNAGKRPQEVQAETPKEKSAIAIMPGHRPSKRPVERTSAATADGWNEMAHWGF